MESGRLTKKALMERKGWTESAIRKFSPSFVERSNPWGPYLDPMLLYSLEDVERIEATAEFAAHLERHLKLSAACKKARRAETPEQKRKRKESFARQERRKTEAAVEFAANAPIEVIRVDDVAAVALKADGDMRESMGYGRTPNPSRRPMWWQHRIVLYYIANRLTNFPELLKRLGEMRKVGEANAILRTRVCDEIDKAYPELAMLRSEGFIQAMIEFGAVLQRV